MIVSGDGLDGQPGEGALTLSDLADGMDEGPEEESAPGELDEGEESSESEAEDDSQEVEDEPQEEATFTIKVNGKDVTLKQSETLEMASKGMDYTAKTMALAEERKGVEVERSKADEYRKANEEALQHTEDRLQAFAQYMQEQVGAPPPIEWAQQDAAYYLAQKEIHEARKGQLQQAFAAIEAVRGEAQRRRQAWMTEQADATEKALSSTLPGWNDAMLEDLAGYLGKSGINPQNAGDAFVTKGLWELAHKAKAYDALQAAKATLKPKTELQKVVKPSQAHTPNRADAKRADAMKRHKAAPSLNTLMDLGDF